MSSIAIRVDYFLYTWRHKLAFLKVEKKVLGHNTLKGLRHDLDKLFLYWLPWLDVEEVQGIHRRHSRHHTEYDGKHCQNEKDYREMIIDWECACLTKPDKPLRAFATMLKWYPQMEDKVLPLMLKLHLVDEAAVLQAVNLGLCSFEEAEKKIKRHGYRLIKTVYATGDD